MCGAAARTPGESDDQIYEITNSFSECSAIQDVLALILTRGDEEEYANHYLHSLANGYIIAAQILAAQGGFTEELVTSMYDSHFSRFITLFKMHKQANKPDEWNAIVETELGKCKALSDLQEYLIAKIRKKIYKKE